MRPKGKVSRDKYGVFKQIICVQYHITANQSKKSKILKYSICTVIKRVNISD